MPEKSFSVQDVYTLKEVAEIIVPNMEKGQYVIDVHDGKAKVSRNQKRWVQREDLAEVK